jgi:hypothetical protein
MEKEHIKLFSGTSIIVRGLQNILDDNQIGYVVKDNVESARLAGFGAQQNDIDLYVLESDFTRAKAFVENYQEKINS